MLRSEILGSLKMKSFLSGMPELKLGLNDKLLMEARGACWLTADLSRTADTIAVARNSGGPKGKGIEMEDVRFHQCVRLSRRVVLLVRSSLTRLAVVGRFENDRTISFVPPDGDFDLMVYRLNTQVRVTAIAIVSRDMRACSHYM